MKKTVRNLLLFIIAFLSGSLIFVLLDGFYVKKDDDGGFQVKTLFTQRFSEEKRSYKQKQSDEKWAQAIVKGGYILHIRHAMREKFTPLLVRELPKGNGLPLLI